MWPIIDQRVSDSVSVSTVHMFTTHMCHMWATDQPWVTIPDLECCKIQHGTLCCMLGGNTLVTRPSLAFKGSETWNLNWDLLGTPRGPLDPSLETHPRLRLCGSAMNHLNLSFQSLRTFLPLVWKIKCQIHIAAIMCSLLEKPKTQASSLHFLCKLGRIVCPPRIGPVFTGSLDGANDQVSLWVCVLIHMGFDCLLIIWVKRAGKRGKYTDSHRSHTQVDLCLCWRLHLYSIP